MRVYMSSFLRSSIAAPAVLITSLALTACSDSLTRPGAAERVSLSFAGTGATAATTGATTTVGGGSTARIAVGSDEIVISRVQLVMKEVELKLPDGMSTCGAGDDHHSGTDDSGHHSAGTDDSGHDCDEVEQGPVLVELPLGGQTAVQSFDVSVPAGTYRELELKLDKPDDDTARDRAFAAAHPELARTSVRVEGTYNGRAFVYTSRVRSEMELSFSPPIVVDAAGTNVTVRIDVSGWFTSSSGALIDPQTANAGGANEAAVAANIRRSFEAFGDDDHDGRRDDGADDHGRHGGRGSDDN